MEILKSENAQKKMTQFLHQIDNGGGGWKERTKETCRL